MGNSTPNWLSAELKNKTAVKSQYDGEDPWRLIFTYMSWAIMVLPPILAIAVLAWVPWHWTVGVLTITLFVISELYLLSLLMIVRNNYE